MFKCWVDLGWAPEASGAGKGEPTRRFQGRFLWFFPSERMCGVQILAESSITNAFHVDNNFQESFGGEEALANVRLRS